MNINKSFQLAVGYYQTGKLPEAESLSRQIIRKQPKHVDALNLIGLICYDLANYDSAIEYIKKALELNPSNAEAYTNLGNAYKNKGLLDKAVISYEKAIKLKPSLAMAHNNLGSTLQEKGRLDEALTCYQRAIKLDPNLVMAYNNLGVALIDKGQLDEAISRYQKAIIINPNFADTYYNLGVVFQKKGQLDDAISYYQKAQKLNPQKADIYFDLGNVLKDQGKMDEAITYYQKAIELNPSFAKAYCNLGSALRKKGQLDKAITHCQKAIELNPSFAKAHCNLGNIFRDKKQFDQAIAYYEKAIQLNPNFAGAYNNLGTVYRDELEFDKAIHCFKKALQIESNFVEAYNNLGICLQEKNQLNESMNCFQKALEINPEFVESHWNMSLALLLSGDFEQGWQKYEWRLRKENHLNYHHEFILPLWDGSSLKGKTLFIETEQGIGDQIMFASCLPEVIAQADLCIVETDKRLVPLFVRSFPSAIIIECLDKRKSYPSNLLRADMSIAIGSLPRYLRQNIKSFPKQKAYLITDKEKTEFWHNRYKALGDGLKVGISWRGGSKISEIRKRSTMLAQWHKLFSIQGIHFINLQYGDCIADLIQAREKIGIDIHNWGEADPLRDLDGFAAQIRAVDMVISIDNSTVHMAGALGVIVWTLLPFASDWRWMLNRADSPWYPTMRLFRQSLPGDWESVIAKVKDELLKLLDNIKK
jgi:tetratricopeptide (TPR) repeat protein